MNIDLATLNKMPLLDVIYLYLRDESPGNPVNLEFLPSKTGDDWIEGISRHLGAKAADYGILRLSSSLSLCDDPGRGEYGGYSDWQVFSRGGRYIAVEIEYPEYSDDEADGTSLRVSDELSEEEMAAYVRGHIQSQLNEITSKAAHLRAALEASDDVLLRGASK